MAPDTRSSSAGAINTSRSTRTLGWPERFTQGTVGDLADEDHLVWPGRLEPCVKPPAMLGGMAEVSRCPSCGLLSASQPQLPAAPFPASPACWEVFGRLTAYDLEQEGEDFRHQVAVDAYAAQHPGHPAKPITLWFALAGLYQALDEGWSGRQVQVAHQRLSRLDKVGPELPEPSRAARTTAADVMAAPGGGPRDAAMTAWAEDVWQSWASRHSQVADALPPLDRLR